MKKCKIKLVRILFRQGLHTERCIVEGKNEDGEDSYNFLIILRKINRALRQREKCKIGMTGEDLTCFERYAAFSTKSTDDGDYTFN